MTMRPKILIVDNEKNISIAMVHALETSGFDVESASDGEQALRMLDASPFDLVFLDFEMHGMNDMEVLRQTSQSWPLTRVIIIAAHGTVIDAVKAMKLGAADFVQKPSTPEEMIELAKSVLVPLPRDVHTEVYEYCLAEARRSIVKRRLGPAISDIRKAFGLDATRPEAFNLLGVAVHMSGQRYKAQDYFRAANALAPTYKPARDNLERSASGGVFFELSLGADAEDAQ